ncbi:MAG: hypothetical protein IJC92_04475 [Bacteroidaceae bacterium]|nr:hypothetical protein [Bacteroidaceae bacterium]
MKALKLILTFIIILGGFVGAYFIFNGGPGGSITGGMPIDKLGNYRKQIERGWEEAGDWNKELFEEYCILIDQLGKWGLDVTPLRNFNTSLVVNIINDKIIGEWKSATCKKQTIKKYMGAVSTVCSKDANAKHNPAIENINKINTVYNKACKQAERSIGLSCGFDADAPSWNSYSNYSNRVTRETNDILNNSIYKEYLANITAIKKGLDNIPSRLATGKKRFADRLATEIIDHYNAIPDTLRTREELNALRKTRDKYDGEFGGDVNLDCLVKEFNISVENNEESRNNEGPGFSIYR